ncbi:hypothetical protein B296_00050700 [Ensete ventricosum]|uniref:Uncharacterized protein n=1 Tax=Ensete ventricosum TaxID=4639 RepID=A0A426XXV0_ENSVE|nr:hypothetical protein B296_00050700 [Ensete ventricosum]
MGREECSERGQNKEIVGRKRMEDWKKSRDLWVLTSSDDVVDNMTVEKDNVRRFYRYIDSFPLIIPDTLFFVYYDQWI